MSKSEPNDADGSGSLTKTYVNLDGTTPDKGFGAILKWQVVDRLAGRRRTEKAKLPTPVRANDGSALSQAQPSLTWIGHATFVQRIGGLLVATDPVWGNVPGGVHRLVDPGVAMEQMPRLDVVTISHSHYDHLDIPTLKRIGPNTLYVVPESVGEVLKKAGLPQVVELPWWGSHTVPGSDLTITLVPAQHWSMRAPWDKNRRLWGGFLYKTSKGTSYHAGDTAFSAEVFEQIAGHGHGPSPKIDWAMLPIGAYDPAWFMQPQHMNPEEAVRAWEILGAKVLVAMHWGTFKLTDEPTDEPPKRLRAEWTRRGHDPARLWILDIGETRKLP